MPKVVRKNWVVQVHKSGSITLPKMLRERLRLRPGMAVEVIQVNDVILIRDARRVGTPIVNGREASL